MRYVRIMNTMQKEEVKMNRDKWILDATQRIADILCETNKSVDTWELIYHLLHEFGLEECEPDDEGGRYFYIDADTRFRNGWYYSNEKQDLINVGVNRIYEKWYTEHHHRSWKDD